MAGPESSSRAVRRGDYPVQGTVRKGPVNLRLGFASDEFGYLIDLGLPPQGKGGTSAFSLDPEIKRECIWHGPVRRPTTMLVNRNGPLVRIRTTKRYPHLKGPDFNKFFDHDPEP
jgi:predicted ATPase